MTDTANLGLPCIEGSQAQKHVTHNDALRILDTLVQLAALDRDLTAPPGSPLEGQRWIVKTSATGAWTGHVNAIAAWQDGAWQFNAPQTGWVAFVADEGTLLVWNGTAWGDFFSTVTSIQNLAMLGIGTTADTTNCLSAKLNNALFVAKTVTEGGDGNLRYKLSKESSTKTLSFLLQDNYSGRAEIGLTGDDDFHFKVSSDGSTWYDSIKIAAATGKVSFPVSGGPREVLIANRTYYVRTDGSDSNTGLANTAGDAFLTIQKAINAVFGTLDLYGFNVTIQIADGTYTGTVIASAPQVGAGTITIQGNNATPANVLISATATVFGAYNGAAFAVQDLKITESTNAGHALYATKGGLITFKNIEFGSVVSFHIRADDYGRVLCAGNYTISGGAAVHWQSSGGNIRVQGVTVTLSGTPNFSVAFATADTAGNMVCSSNTYSGSATGSRYDAQTNGVIRTGGATLPGNAAGTTASGGQYA